MRPDRYWSWISPDSRSSLSVLALICCRMVKGLSLATTASCRRYRSSNADLAPAYSEERTMATWLRASSMEPCMERLSWASATFCLCISARARAACVLRTQLVMKVLNLSSSVMSSSSCAVLRDSRSTWGAAASVWGPGPGPPLARGSTPPEEVGLEPGGLICWLDAVRMPTTSCTTAGRLALPGTTQLHSSRERQRIRPVLSTAGLMTGLRTLRMGRS
mmetsp:Transcript_28127/g.61728  ORF Transcript_28127/g.61728 Transcript_28127/m.61728 type:complete len:219 (+) Transcript_28127:182-838(+)